LALPYMPPKSATGSPSPVSVPLNSYGVYPAGQPWPDVSGLLNERSPMPNMPPKSMRVARADVPGGEFFSASSVCAHVSRIASVVVQFASTVAAVFLRTASTCGSRRPSQRANAFGSSSSACEPPLNCV
jgi:hypothetical protein